MVSSISEYVILTGHISVESPKMSQIFPRGTTAIRRVIPTEDILFSRHKKIHPWEVMKTELGSHMPSIPTRALLVKVSITISGASIFMICLFTDSLRYQPKSPSSIRQKYQESYIHIFRRTEPGYSGLRVLMYRQILGTEARGDSGR